MKFVSRTERPHRDFTDGISNAVSFVSRSMRVTGIRGSRHPDPHPPHRHGRGRESNGRGSALAQINLPKRKRLPEPPIGSTNGIVAGKELHRVLRGVRIDPRNSDRIHHLWTV